MDLDDMTRKISGLLLPIPTPFKQDGSVDETALRNVIDFYIDNQASGIAPCGSTGEFAALTQEERRRVVEISIDEANGKITVLAGTHAITTAETVSLTKHAKDAGADGVLVVPPYYIKPSEEELYGHYAEIGKVGIPVTVYNNPFTSKVDMRPELIAKLANDIDMVRYVKESSGVLQRIHEIFRLTDKITVLCGSDDLALESFMMGAKGWVAAAGNICPKQASELFRLSAIEKNNENALKLYNRLLPLFNLLESTGRYVQYVKAGLDLLGHPVGQPRKPYLSITAKEREELRSMMIRAGILS